MCITTCNVIAVCIMIIIVIAVCIMTCSVIAVCIMTCSVIAVCIFSVVSVLALQLQVAEVEKKVQAQQDELYILLNYKVGINMMHTHKL